MVGIAEERKEDVVVSGKVRIQGYVEQTSFRIRRQRIQADQRLRKNTLLRAEDAQRTGQFFRDQDTAIREESHTPGRVQRTGERRLLCKGAVA